METHIDTHGEYAILAFARLHRSPGVVPDEAGTACGDSGRDGVGEPSLGSERPWTVSSRALASGSRLAATCSPRSVHSGGAGW